MCKGNSVTILTYNLGLLKLQPFGIGPATYENPPFVNERFPHMAGNILTSDADILVLQEVWRESHAKSLVEALKGKYPYVVRSSLSSWWQLHNGLMLFSKFPITNYKLIKHAKAERIESIFGSKCMQVVELSTSMGPIMIVNMHATAGGIDPESCNEIRESELEEAMAECAAFSSRSPDHRGRAIIVGDLNMGPEESKSNYDFMVEKGYVDGVLQAATNDGNTMHTWDPKNILNAEGVHSHCPSCRIDHLFFEQDSQFCVTEASLFMNEAFIPVMHRGKEKNVTLSDHYGVLMNLSVV